MSKIKQLPIVLTICIILAGAVVLLYLLDPDFVPDAYRIISMVIVVFYNTVHSFRSAVGKKIF